jgi:excisionase family DNA binding protein
VIEELDDRIAHLRAKERALAQEREELERAITTAPITSLLMKPQEAARYIGVGRQHMYRLLRPGPYGAPPEIPSIKVGARNLLVPRQACDEWVRAQMDSLRSLPRAVKRA